MKIYFLAFILFFSTAVVSAETSKVNIRYKASGLASFDEDYLSASSSLQCRRDHSVVKETSGASWDVQWKRVAVRPVLQKAPSTAQFSGQLNVEAESFADMSACQGQKLNSCSPQEAHCVLFQDACENASLSFLDTFHPGLTIKKSGKNFVLTVEGEKELQAGAPISPTPAPSFAMGRTVAAASSLCFGSSAFDNAVVQGLGNTSITGVKIKLTAADKNTRTVLKVKLQKEYDCKDPAKVLSGLGTNCYIATDFSGTITVNGKWKAKLVR